jgi:hypothetical protein
MDAALRHVAHALLVGVDEKQVMEHALQVQLKLTSVGWGYFLEGEGEGLGAGKGTFLHLWPRWGF